MRFSLRKQKRKQGSHDRGIDREAVRSPQLRRGPGREAGQIRRRALPNRRAARPCPHAAPARGAGAGVGARAHVVLGACRPRLGLHPLRVAKSHAQRMQRGLIGIARRIEGSRRGGDSHRRRPIGGGRGHRLGGARVPALVGQGHEDVLRRRVARVHTEGVRRPQAHRVDGARRRLREGPSARALGSPFDAVHPRMHGNRPSGRIQDRREAGAPEERDPLLRREPAGGLRAVRPQALLRGALQGRQRQRLRPPPGGPERHPLRGPRPGGPLRAVGVAGGHRLPRAKGDRTGRPARLVGAVGHPGPQGLRAGGRAQVVPGDVRGAGRLVSEDGGPPGDGGAVRRAAAVGAEDRCGRGR